MLTTLYFFQGLPIGLFLQTIPLMYKEFLSYQELGVLALCTMPYSFKVFWSPLIELYHLPSLGKRKTWVVPT